MYEMHMCSAQIITLLCMHVFFFVVSSFSELSPTLIRQTGPGTYILSEAFCQDPLERYSTELRIEEAATTTLLYNNSGKLLKFSCNYSKYAVN